jgi:hypothetical protein
MSDLTETATGLIGLAAGVYIADKVIKIVDKNNKKENKKDKPFKW